MKHIPPYFLGIDVGTQGSRVACIDAAGTLVSSASENFPLTVASAQEQHPDAWWQSCQLLLKKVVQDIKGVVTPEEIRSVAVTSTSGTVIPVDADYNCLHPAIMYSDKRSSADALLCRIEAELHATGSFTGFNSSCGLPKMIWFVNHYPEKVKHLHQWVHASDFITAKLSGRWGITDYTNVLKSGYDLTRKEWPDYLFSRLSLRKEWMPEVTGSGDPVGKIELQIAKELGLHPGTEVVTGMTDGCASQIASGAASPGEWNTTIGTTMVIKGITAEPVNDPAGRIYNHLHPQGYWMPGGASNTGADWISKNVGTDLEDLGRDAAAIIPTGKFTYPLEGKGERFPFIAPDAIGFQPRNLTAVQKFASGMEGVAYIERYAYEIIQKLGTENVRSVFVAGGGSNSDTWLRIRANVLNHPLYKMKQVTGCVGAAILAASKTHFSSLSEATGNLCQLEKEIAPDTNLAGKYDDLYGDFIDILRGRGYI